MRRPRICALFVAPERAHSLARGAVACSPGIGDRQQCAFKPICRDACPFRASESVTVTVKGLLWACVIVPLIVQVAGFSVRPEGSAPEVTEHVKGGNPPVNAIVAWYDLPGEPAGRVDWVITGFVAPESGSTCSADSST